MKWPIKGLIRLLITVHSTAASHHLECICAVLLGCAIFNFTLNLTLGIMFYLNLQASEEAITLSLSVGPGKTDTVKDRIDGNSPNTSAEGTAPSEPSVAFIALTDISSRVSFDIFWYSSFSLRHLFRNIT